MNGLERERGKENRSGREGRKGMAKRSIGKEAHQADKEMYPTMAQLLFFSLLEGKPVIWEKDRSQYAARRGTTDEGRPGNEQGSCWLGDAKGKAWRISKAAGTELCRGKGGMEEAEHLEMPQHFTAYSK